MKDQSQEKAFLKSQEIDESFIQNGSQRIYHLELLSEYKDYLIEQGLIVDCEKYEALAEKWYNVDQEAKKVSYLEAENARLRADLDRIANLGWKSENGKYFGLSEAQLHGVCQMIAHESLNPNSKEAT